MPNVPFSQRMGLDKSPPISGELSDKARVAIAYVVNEIGDAYDYEEAQKVTNELLRTARLTSRDFEFSHNSPFLLDVIEIFGRMEWWQIFTALENIYERHMYSIGWMDNGNNYVENLSVSDVRKKFTNQMNQAMAEENLAYEFVDGEFQRRGRAHTQTMIKRVGSVLADEGFSAIRNHYNKARSFFDERPIPDVENCVKEALCALEAAIEILTGKQASKDLKKAISSFQGTGEGEIPPPLAQSIIKIHAYRGSAKGVAHSASDGVFVGELEAELLLSLVAGFITYLIDLLHVPEDDIPF